MQFRCPNCDHEITIADDPQKDDLATVDCPSCHSSLELASPPETTVIGDRDETIAHFELRNQLGEGGFGIVHKAWDSRLERFVAIKIPRPGRSDARQKQQQFREARAAAAIQHQNVVRVHEVGMIDDGLYIVSEFIDGVSLEEWLKHNTPSPKSIALLVARICDGVQAAHEKKVIHRDLKPANVLLNTVLQENQPMVTDFGLAKRQGGDVTVTRNGEVFGSIPYMSPEQAAGHADEIDHRTDVYALGVILYEALAGRRPFVAAKGHTILYLIATQEAKPPSAYRRSVPRDLDTICLKALSKDKHHRYQSAAEFAADLRRYAAGEPILAKPASFLTKIYKYSRRNPAATTSMFLFAVFILTLGYLWTATHNLHTPQPIAGVPHQGTDAQGKASTHYVQITARRNDGAPVKKCRWIVYPINSDTYAREPPSTSHSDTPTLSIELKPGLYWIIAIVDQWGFQEVFRTVPEDPTTPTTAAHNHRRWISRSDTSLCTLPDVIVPCEEDVTANMVRIPGGPFQLHDIDDTLVEQSRHTHDFWIGKTEVTVAEYSKLQNWPPPDDEQWQTPDAAIVKINWDSAVAAAEGAGCRLMLEDEYQFMVTELLPPEWANGSMQDISPSAWGYGPVHRPRPDVLPNHPVGGLISDAAEWTMSGFMRSEHVDSASMLDPHLAALMGGGLVVRGGPVDSMHESLRKHNTGPFHITQRLALDAKQARDEVGFRLARSVRESLASPIQSEQPN